MEDVEIIAIRRHILENAIHLHENVINSLKQEIYSLEELNPENFI